MADKKIAVFKALVAAGKYDFTDEIVTFLVECIKKADLDKVVEAAPQAVAATAVTAPPATKQTTKKLTGYNIFMKEKMAEFKAKNMPVAERMGAVSQAWKALNDAEKGTWKAKADKVDPVPVTAKAQPAKKGPKSMTGYQFYVKEQMPTIKADKNILAKDRLSELGKRWKALTEKIQADYKAKAAVVSPPPVKTA